MAKNTTKTSSDSSSSLLDRMQSSGSIKNSMVLDESIFFNKKDVIPTELAILNIAFSGEVDGGLVPGLTVVSGESKSFKTLLSLYCLKAYFNKYPNSVCLFYDSEFGVTPAYLRKFDIDPKRVIHIPVEHVEQLKFDIVKRLEQIQRGDKVFILLDSLGNLASKKEVDDATNENSAADMSRARAIKSLFRIVTPHLTTKDLPMLVINHVYKTMEMFAKTVNSGGSGLMYSANQVFIITKAQEKDGEELAGYRFTINIEKSRFVKEKSKFPFVVRYDTGIQAFSGLLDIALLGNYIVKPSKGWYSIVDRETGEIFDEKYRESDFMTREDLWEYILNHTDFKDFVRNRYTLDSPLTEVDEEITENEGVEEV